MNSSGSDIPKAVKTPIAKCAVCMHKAGLGYLDIGNRLGRHKKQIIRWVSASGMKVERNSATRAKKKHGKSYEKYDWWRYEWAGVKRIENFWARHPLAVSAMAIKRYKIRYKTDSAFRVKFNVRKRLRAFLKIKGINKTRIASKSIGCTGRQLKEHIESKFQAGMTWLNYGKAWSLDHIVPLAVATNERDAFALNHWSNLQPLWSADNIRKGDKVPRQSVLI